MLTFKNKLRENKEENLTAEIINYTTKNLINTEKPDAVMLITDPRYFKHIFNIF